MPQLGRNLFRFFKALKLEYFSAFSNDFEMQKATDQFELKRLNVTIIREADVRLSVRVIPLGIAASFSADIAFQSDVYADLRVASATWIGK